MPTNLPDVDNIHPDAAQPTNIPWPASNAILLLVVFFTWLAKPYFNGILTLASVFLNLVGFILSFLLVPAILLLHTRIIVRCRISYTHSGVYLFSHLCLFLAFSCAGDAFISHNLFHRIYAAINGMTVEFARSEMVKFGFRDDFFNCASMIFGIFLIISWIVMLNSRKPPKKILIQDKSGNCSA